MAKNPPSGKRGPFPARRPRRRGSTAFLTLAVVGILAVLLLTRK